jgi:hypothetical protein
MSKLNLLLSLQSYNDSVPTNAPFFNHFKWDRQSRGICANNPISNQLTINPGINTVLFNGALTTSQDNTTTYNLYLKPNTIDTYVLHYNSGTQPNFRTPFVTSADATTQISVTVANGLTTFTSTGGTSLVLGAVNSLVGKYLRTGAIFNPYNQGSNYIVANTANSVTIAITGIAEIQTLGSNFNDMFAIYSADGIQINNKVILQGFSSAIFNTYTITDVSYNYIEFYSGTSLPTQNAVQANPLFYADAKKWIYIETDKKCDIIVNGETISQVEPMCAGINKVNGVFMSSSIVWDLEIKNTDISPAKIFFAAIE